MCVYGTTDSVLYSSSDDANEFPPTNLFSANDEVKEHQR